MGEQIRQIYHWYSQNKRDLPWRETSDPYKIWISEIILQQTRVAQGTEYYHRFIEEFPTIVDLAKASEDDVLKLWQGLGYYTRARNLHTTAKKIAADFDGKFPSDYKTILSLKGIGNYTAAAIASIAFDLPHPAIDGNIYRVLSRYFGVSTPIDSSKGKKEFQEIAEALMPLQNTGFHNQALMEFGALQCTPKSPDCPHCPLLGTCFAAQNNKIDQLPVKSKKTKQRTRYFLYFLIEEGDFIYLEKRTDNDIWKNLYQLPVIESEEKLSDQQILTLNASFMKNRKSVLKSVSAQKKHILSHQIIFARMIHVELKSKEPLSGKLVRINKKDISKFAIPKLVQDFLNECCFQEN